MKGYFLSANMMLLQLSGLWPPIDESTFSFKLYRVYQVFFFLMATVYSSFAVLIGTLQTRKDFNAFLKAQNLGLTLIVACIKVTFWYINFKEIKRIVLALENVKIEDFQPKMDIQKAKRHGTILSLVLLASAYFTLAFAYFPRIVSSFWYHLQGRSISGMAEYETLPYYIYVPFEYDTALKYSLVSTFQFIPTFCQSTNIIAIDCVFMNLLNLIATHISVLQEALRSLRGRCLERITGVELSPDGLHNSTELEEEMMKEMRKCIDFLHMILRSCKELEEIFKYLTLAQALSAMFTLCSTLLILSTAGFPSGEFGKATSYLIGLLLQVGLCCWFGNEVTLKGLDIPDALWESDWLESRRPFKVCVYLTMMRMYTPVYLTAGKFAPLTLSTFISVVKAAYSFYTMLNKTKK